MIPGPARRVQKESAGKAIHVVVHVYLFDAQFCLGALLGGESAAYH
jgi:hypothetical protein